MYTALKTEHGIHATLLKGRRTSTRFNIYCRSHAKLVDRGSHGEGADHAAHAEDCHRKTPHHGVGARAEGLAVALHGHVLEEPAQFLLGGSE